VRAHPGSERRSAEHLPTVNVRERVFADLEPPNVNGLNIIGTWMDGFWVTVGVGKVYAHKGLTQVRSELTEMALK
jgi:hypothetical protein